MAMTDIGHAGSATDTGPMPWWRRIAPAVGLFLLAPLVAEFLLGNIAIDALAALIVLAPMYGGAAVLIRETARRIGRGWPTMILLGLAYGVFEEGVVTQSLFNPDYAGAELLDVTYVPLLGIGVWWTLFVLTLHTVWSTCVPIAIVEALVPKRSDTPWLGTIGLGVVAVLFALGAALNFVGTMAQYQFLATPAQLSAAVAVTLVLIAGAVLLPVHPREPLSDVAPQAWQVAAFSLVTGSIFLLSPITMMNNARGREATPIFYLMLYLVVIWNVSKWSRRPGWSGMHTLALAGGALLAYAWHAYPQPPVLGSTGTIDVIGNAIFGLGAIILLAAAVAAQRSVEPKAAG